MCFCEVYLFLYQTKLSTPLKKRIDYLSGSLKNISDCNFCLSNNIHLDADKTSNYDFYNLNY